MHGVLSMLILFGFITAVVIVPQILKSRDRQRMFETMRAAYERGQPVPAELVDAMMRPRSRPPVSPEALEAMMAPRGGDPLDFLPESAASRDLRRGVVWTAVGVGLILIGAFFYAGLYNDGGAAETFATFSAFGAIPFCIGIAFLGLWFFNRKPVQAARSYAPDAGYAPAPPPPTAAAAPPRSEL